MNTSSLSTIPATPSRKSAPIGSVSRGAATGIGLGCAVVGVIVTVIAFLLIRRSRRGRALTAGREEHLNGSLGPSQKSPSGLYNSPAVELAHWQPPATLEGSLLLPADDQSIRGELSKICTLIKNHVQSYYHTASHASQRISPRQSALQELGQDVPILIVELARLLENPRTRTAALRFCIAWTAISRSAVGCESDMSFLPPDLMKSYALVSTTAEDPQSTLVLCLSGPFRLLVLINYLARRAYLSKWRTISAALLQKATGHTNFSAADPRSGNVNRALELLDSILRPYSSQRHDDAERFNNLREILKRAARFGFLLFSQPSLWQFDWSSSRGNSRESLVIFPALVQVEDEDGRILTASRLVSEQEVVRLGG